MYVAFIESVQWCASVPVDDSLFGIMLFCEYDCGKTVENSTQIRRIRKVRASASIFVMVRHPMTIRIGSDRYT